MKPLYEAITYDLRFGIVRRWWLFIPALLWGVYLAFCVDNACAAGIQFGAIAEGETFTLADVCVYAFRSTTFVLIPPSSIRQLPVEWLIWHVYLSLTVSLYTHKQICHIGQQQLIRFRRRTHWWVGKCVWCLCSVLSSYACLFIGLFSYTALRGSWSATISPWLGDVIGFFIRPEYAAIGFSTLAQMLILTVFCSVVLCQWQTSLVLIVKPLGAFLSAVVVTVIPVFIHCPWLFTAYTIWLNHTALGYGTLEPLGGFLVSGLFYAAALVFGMVRFSKDDILQIQEA